MEWSLNKTDFLFEKELEHSVHFRRKKGKKISHQSYYFFANLQKMNFGLIEWAYCKWEEALFSHENVQKGVFSTSVFAIMQLNLSSVGCELCTRNKTLLFCFSHFRCDIILS